MAVDDNTIQQAFAAFAGNQVTQGGGTQQKAVVPLWQLRSDVGKPTTPINYAGKRDSEGQNYAAPEGQFTEPIRESSYGTEDQANAAWFDMTDDQRKQFVESAREAGIDIKDGSSAAAAWSKAVKLAADYNSTKTDKKVWLSPLEAMKKIGAYSDAQIGARFKTSKNVSTQTFNTSDVASAATDVLRKELGRDPSADEIRSYQAALNAAALQSPEVTTSVFDSLNNATASTKSGGINPTQLITDLAKASPEHARYQAAAELYPAAMAALSAIV